MQKWFDEDWEFEMTAIEGIAGHCRIGLEKGDRFAFQYETPANFCPRAMIEIYTWCEVIRCGGDFTQRGAESKYEMDLWCPCHCIQFHLLARPINRDKDGEYTGVSRKPAPIQG